MAKLCGQDVSTDEAQQIEAEVEAVLEQFGGDAHAAILALLQEFAILVYQASALELDLLDPGVDEGNRDEPDGPVLHGRRRGMTRRRLQ